MVYALLYYTLRIVYNLKGNIMKSLFLIVASMFALSAIAADAPKAADKAAPATAPAAKAEVKKDDKKPAKSEPAKKDAPKADAKAATPAAK
jgi:hypothetical protein